MSAYNQNTNNIANEEFEYSQSVIKKLSDYYDEIVVGQENLKFALINALMADGHILIESVPGLAKTTAAKAIANAVDGKFSRIQCTPDLLPSDILGTQIYNQTKGKFETILGPVFANFVLLDEINRSSAKTQSAMLEAMQEKQITIAGVEHKMPEDVFIVIATQNPIEQEGTYPLSEAQTDRFLIKETLTYPTPEEEAAILSRISFGQEKLPPVLNIDDINNIQAITEKVYLDAAIRKYIAMLIHATRNTKSLLKEEYSKYVKLGASPRASIALMKMSKAVALNNNRTYVIPEDIKAVRHQVLRHRISLTYGAKSEGITPEIIIDQIFNNIPTP